ncbi:MAG: hypothetical protein WBA44_01065 [Mesorhizobium sp.]
MTIRSDKTLAGFPRTFDLTPGKHTSPEDGMCAMEVVAFLAGGPHSDHPRCACPIVSGYVRHVNDNMPDDHRQRLLPYLPRLVDSVSEDHEQARHEYFAWQAVRVFAPAALRAQGYRRYARSLENAADLYRARDIAEDIQRSIMAKDVGAELSPGQLAAHRAGSAAGAATWFASQRDDFFKGASAITPYTECADAAAGAAFQAYRAGVTDIWDKALEALGGALAIGAGADGSAMPSR